MMNIRDFITQTTDFLPGNETQAKLALLGILLNRSVLIEDVPGMGKTTLVKYLAKITGLDFRRIQFTSDLLPSDILGISVFNKETEKFVFKQGPIFGELILADELNRGTPKTQSALLQAMEEKVVSVDGQSFNLPSRFCLIATQNPRGQFGTYPLPESQLDRFLFKFSMGHLSKKEEMLLLQSGSRLEMLEEMQAFISHVDLKKWEEGLKKVTASTMLMEYLTDILQASRQKEDAYGLSPRAGLDLLSASKAWAYLENRDYVIPDDIQEVFPFVAGHRMYSQHSLSALGESIRAKEFIKNIPFIKEK